MKKALKHKSRCAPSDARSQAGAASIPLRLTRVILPVLVFLFCLGHGALAVAQNLPAAGSGQNMWVVLPESDKGLTILHRNAADEPGHFWKVTTLLGVLAPGGATSGDGQLWMIYSNQMVQSMQVAADPYMPQARYSQARFGPQLPAGVTVRSLAASADGLWALVDVKTVAALEAIDGKPVSKSVPPVPTEKKPAAAADTATSTATPATTPAAAEAQLPEAQARLVLLERGRWITQQLPTDWPALQRAWLVFTDPKASHPTLIVEPKGQESKAVRVYRFAKDQWTSQAYEAQTAGDVMFLSVQQQLVMARHPVDQDKMLVTLSVLRPERTAAVELGTLGFDMPRTVNWGVATNGLLATLVARYSNDPVRYTSMNLQGQVVDPPAAIKVEPPTAFVQDPGQMVLVGVVAISIFLMFVIWRRDPAQVEIALPQNLVLGDFGRRIAAAGIDLVPCIFIAMLATGVSLNDLFQHWPGRSGSWRAMLPGFITIGLFVLHTGVSELFTGKTLGKALLGLQVISTDGKPPNIWQVLARNLLKTFDLIAFYILPILALVGKYYQRLGDLVGKTVVVMHDQQPPEIKPPEDEDKSA